MNEHSDVSNFISKYEGRHKQQYGNAISKNVNYADMRSTIESKINESGLSMADKESYKRELDKQIYENAKNHFGLDNPKAYIEEKFEAFKKLDQRMRHLGSTDRKPNIHGIRRNIIKSIETLVDDLHLPNSVKQLYRDELDKKLPHIEEIPNEQRDQLVSQLK